MTLQEMVEDEKFLAALEGVLVSFTERTEKAVKAMPELRERILVLEAKIRDTQ